MRSFKFVLADDRFTAPQVLDVCVRHEDRARELAGQVLRQSQHHRGIKVLDDEGRQLFALA